MDFKSIGLKAAIATAVVASSTVAMAPAQAFTFHKGSFLKFNVDNELKSVTATGVKFKDGSIKVSLDSDGTFAPYGGTQASIKDFAYTIVGGAPKLSSTIKDFITLKKAGQPDITFDLTGFSSAVFFEDGTTADKFGAFNAAIEGVFHADGVGQVADPTSVITALVFKASGTNNFTSSISVPTPALLPGLVGLGVGFVRKRKQLAKQEANA